jgi:hypothetical protein
MRKRKAYMALPKMKSRDLDLHPILAEDAARVAAQE